MKVHTQHVTQNDHPQTHHSRTVLGLTEKTLPKGATAKYNVPGGTYSSREQQCGVGNKQDNR